MTTYTQAIELLRGIVRDFLEIHEDEPNRPSVRAGREALADTSSIESPTSEPVQGASIDTWQDRMRRDDYAQALSVYCRAEIADLRTALASQSASVEEAARLEFLMEREAWIAWSKDGESCRLFHRSDDGEPMPMLGWGARHWSHDPREAIDAAINAERARSTGKHGGESAS